MQTSVDDYLTPRHRTLKLIARAAGILAYAALIGFALLAAATAFAAYQQARVGSDAAITFMRPARLDLNLGIAFVTRLLDGVIFWVLLIGLSLGLRMVIETDVNYRLGATETDDAEADNG